MSDALNIFCKAILVSLGEDDSPPWFNKGHGLCSNALAFDLRFTENLHQELEEMFGGEEFPFNDGSSSKYVNERSAKKFYENEKRLAFLRKYAII